MTPLLSRKRANNHVSISLLEIKRFLSGYIVECRYRQLSPATIACNSGMVSKLVWWLEHTGSDTCGRMEIQQFLSYVGDGHTDRAGRWGKADEHTANRPSTLLTYHARLSAFFTWLETEEFIEASPMENVKPPIVRRDQIQPFTEDQVSSLLEAAKEAMEDHAKAFQQSLQAASGGKLPAEVSSVGQPTGSQSNGGSNTRTPLSTVNSLLGQKYKGPAKSG